MVGSKMGIGAKRLTDAGEQSFAAEALCQRFRSADVSGRHRGLRAASVGVVV